MYFSNSCFCMGDFFFKITIVAKIVGLLKFFSQLGISFLGLRLCRPCFWIVFPKYFSRIRSKVCYMYIQNIRLCKADVLNIHITYFWPDLEKIFRKNTSKKWSAKPPPKKRNSQVLIKILQIDQNLAFNVFHILNKWLYTPFQKMVIYFWQGGGESGASDKKDLGDVSGGIDFGYKFFCFLTTFSW